jgi:hypothetical protein
MLPLPVCEHVLIRLRTRNQHSLKESQSAPTQVHSVLESSRERASRGGNRVPKQAGANEGNDAAPKYGESQGVAKHFCNQAVREAERLFAFHSVNGSPCARCVDMSGPRR